MKVDVLKERWNEVRRDGDARARDLRSDAERSRDLYGSPLVYGEPEARHASNERAWRRPRRRQEAVCAEENRTRTSGNKPLTIDGGRRNCVRASSARLRSEAARKSQTHRAEIGAGVQGKGSKHRYCRGFQFRCAEDEGTRGSAEGAAGWVEESIILVPKKDDNVLKSGRNIPSSTSSKPPRHRRMKL